MCEPMKGENITKDIGRKRNGKVNERHKMTVVKKEKKKMNLTHKFKSNGTAITVKIAWVSR